jgi:cytochrome c-type protein NapB
MKMRLVMLLPLVAATLSWAAPPAPFTDAMRGPVPIADSTKPPALLGGAENKDIRRTRTYSMQPPTIPHRVDGYQIDRNFNKCLTCHARVKIEQTQAIPLSVTHYMDRGGNVLADISPRRYFCNQCHVAQMGVKPLIANTFQDVDTVMKDAAAKARAKKK